MYKNLSKKILAQQIKKNLELKLNTFGPNVSRHILYEYISLLFVLPATTTTKKKSERGREKEKNREKKRNI